MKKLLVCLLPAFALLFLSTLAGRADQFDQIENSPYTYWVPPAAGEVAAAPPPYYYGPPPPAYYYGPPPPRVHFFFGFHFH